MYHTLEILNKLLSPFCNLIRYCFEQILIICHYRYRNVGQVGGIIDRRFTGEVENSATVRYAIERKRSKKASKFDLDSDSDNDMQNMKLTHNGENIEGMDEFKHKTNPDDLNDDKEDKFIDDKIVEQLHFGGGDINKADEGDDFFKVKKTKQEVFKEIMAKSKMFKAARAELKDQNMELTEQIDLEFKELMPMLMMRKREENLADKPKVQGTTVNLLEIAKRKNEKEIEKKNANRRFDQKIIHKMAPAIESNYNELAIEMRHDCRVRPSQVNKTEQEKALDRKAELTDMDKNKRVKIAEDEESDYASELSPDEDKEVVDTDQLNHNLVDLVNENEDDDEPDEFEAIDESQSD